jgi:hypothetical protein
LIVLKPNPRPGRKLLRRISPCIGVVNVEQNMEAEFLRCLRRRKRVFEIIRKIGRRVKKPEPHPAITVGLQQFKNWSWRAIFFEDNSLLLGLPQERNVGADGILLPISASGNQ